MIHDILKQRIISLKQAITMSGHSLSMKRVLAMVSSSVLLMNIVVELLIING